MVQASEALASEPAVQLALQQEQRELAGQALFVPLLRWAPQRAPAGSALSLSQPPLPPPSPLRSGSAAAGAPRVRPGSSAGRLRGRDHNASHGAARARGSPSGTPAAHRGSSKNQRRRDAGGGLDAGGEGGDSGDGDAALTRPFSSSSSSIRNLIAQLKASRMHSPEPAPDPLSEPGGEGMLVAEELHLPAQLQRGCGLATPVAERAALRVFGRQGAWRICRCYVTVAAVSLTAGGSAVPAAVPEAAQALLVRVFEAGMGQRAHATVPLASPDQSFPALAAARSPQGVHAPQPGEAAGAPPSPWSTAVGPEEEDEGGPGESTFIPAAAVAAAAPAELRRPGALRQLAAWLLARLVLRIGRRTDGRDGGGRWRLEAAFVRPQQRHSTKNLHAPTLLAAPWPAHRGGEADGGGSRLGSADARGGHELEHGSDCCSTGSDDGSRGRGSADGQGSPPASTLAAAAQAAAAPATAPIATATALPAPAGSASESEYSERFSPSVRSASRREAEEDAAAASSCDGAFAGSAVPLTPMPSEANAARLPLGASVTPTDAVPPGHAAEATAAGSHAATASRDERSAAPAASSSSSPLRRPVRRSASVMSMRSALSSATSAPVAATAAAAAGGGSPSPLCPAPPAAEQLLEGCGSTRRSLHARVPSFTSLRAVLDDSAGAPFRRGARGHSAAAECAGEQDD